MLKTSRLEPPPIGRAVQKVVRILALVVHPRRTGSLPLPPSSVHLLFSFFLLFLSIPPNPIQDPIESHRLHFPSVENQIQLRSDYALTKPIGILTRKRKPITVRDNASTMRAQSSMETRKTENGERGKVHVADELEWRPEAE